jgi:predicted metalloprotease
MRWQGGRRSDNVEDRRGSPMALGGRRMTLGGGCLTLVVVLIALYFGADLGQVLRIVNQVNGPVVVEQGGEPRAASPEDDEKVEFVKAVLASTEDAWTAIFAEQVGQPYVPPRLVIFSDAVNTGCGMADARVGPFYCPADRTVYLDLSFFRELDQRFGAPGDFAQAYVIAHEVGHHVQNLLGKTDEVHAAQQRAGGGAEANELSVMLELQADFYAGVWANRADKMRNIIEEGDVEEALDAANAIGDDRLQKQARGHVNPDTFTHGSSAQRVKWFRRGLQTGDLRQGDTFNAPSL